MFALQSTRVKDAGQCGVIVQPRHFRSMGCVLLSEGLGVGVSTKESNQMMAV